MKHDDTPAFIDTDDNPNAPIILGQGDYRTTPSPNALFSGCLWSVIGLAVIVIAVAIVRALV